jgi:hypothetical protein
MRCGSDRCELFRVSDAVWSLAGFGPADVACVACTEQLLGRSLGLPDLMPFPWWGMNRPHYYRGVIDGARGAAEGTHPDYLAGASLGKRLAAHSTPDEVERFVAPFVRPRS